MKGDEIVLDFTGEERPLKFEDLRHTENGKEYEDHARACLKEYGEILFRNIEAQFCERPRMERTGYMVTPYLGSIKWILVVDTIDEVIDLGWKLEENEYPDAIKRMMGISPA